MAVQLHPRTKKLGKDEVNSNTFVFLQGSEGKVGAFSVYDGGQNPAPVWRLFNAENFGVFVVDPVGRTAPIKLHYLCGETGGLSIQTRDAVITAQLRYEYALNLIQKLGVEMTRVGLDYLSPS